MRNHHEDCNGEKTNHHQHTETGITFSFLDNKTLLASLKINPSKSESSSSQFSHSTIDANGINFEPLRIHEARPNHNKHHHYPKTESIEESKERNLIQPGQQAEKSNWHAQIENDSVTKQADWLKKIAGPDGTISQQDYLKAVKELADSSSSGTDAKAQQQKWIASSVIYEALKNSGNKPVSIESILPKKEQTLPSKIQECG